MLYSSVGHGGASGYLAAMALFGMEPAMMKPAVLTMNIFVTTLVLARLARAGYFNWRLFLPFAAGSLPLAFVGGALTLNASAYRVIVGLSLLLASLAPALAGRGQWPGAATLRLDRGAGRRGARLRVGADRRRWRHLPQPAAAAVQLDHHARQRRDCRSLHPVQFHRRAGRLRNARPQPGRLAFRCWWRPPFAGALLGSELGVRQLAPWRLRQVLCVVLVIAGAKMIATA